MKSIPAHYKKFLSIPKKNCNFCNSKNLKLWTKVSFFKVDECSNCGLIFVNPSLNSDGLNLFYKKYFLNRKEHSESKKLRFLQYDLDKKFLLLNINTNKELKIIDIGGGGGEFLSCFPKKIKKSLLEISPDAVNYAKKKYKINAILGNLYESKIKSKFDVVMMRGVLEHFTDPKKALFKSLEMLKKGGYLYITATPNIDSICAQLYKEQWRLFNPLDHIYYFNIKMISKLILKKASLYKHKYFYEETPYANIEKDFQYVLDDIMLLKNKIKITRQSPPFYRNMMTVLYKKK